MSVRKETEDVLDLMSVLMHVLYPLMILVSVVMCCIFLLSLILCLLL